MPVLPDDPEPMGPPPVLSVNAMSRAAHEVWLVMGRSNSPFCKPWAHLPPMARATVSRQSVALYALLREHKLLAENVVFKDEYLDLMAGKREGWVDPEAENQPQSTLDDVSKEVHNRWVDSGDRTGHSLGAPWDGLSDSNKAVVRKTVEQAANAILIGNEDQSIDGLAAMYAKMRGGGRPAESKADPKPPGLKLAGGDPAEPDEAVVVRIARVCHEANRKYCASIGDNSQPRWEKAPEWQKASAINGVKFHLANPDAGPRGSHENWMAEKAKDGWVYGEKKNPNAAPPTHPCMVPYDELPESQRRKDSIFVETIREELAKLAPKTPRSEPERRPAA